MSPSDAESPPGMPRWVKVFIAVLVGIALLALAIVFTGLGGPSHGPGRHATGMLIGVMLPVIPRPLRHRTACVGHAAGVLTPAEGDHR